MAGKSIAEKNAADIATEVNQFALEDSILANIDSIEDAFAALAEAGVEVEEYKGSWGEVLNNRDKDRLVGVECMIVQWQFYEGKFGDDFVAAYVMTRTGEKYVVNDGSTGLRRQLHEITDARIMRGAKQPQAGLHLLNGLRRSDYEFTDEKGVTSPASTYYIG